LHLSHGFQSVLQTVSLNSPKVRKPEMRWGGVLAWAIFLGYASIPVAVLTGMLTLK